MQAKSGRKRDACRKNELSSALWTVQHFCCERKKPHIPQHPQNRNRNSEDLRINPLVHNIAVKLGIQIAKNRICCAKMYVGRVYGNQKAYHGKPLDSLVNSLVFDV
jgi:hypothetical protein